MEKFKIAIRPRADCCSDHELLVAKLRLKLQKAGKTTRWFGYDVNQIPHYYTMQMMNTFRELDLVDRVPEKLCTEVHNTEEEMVAKTIPKKKKCEKEKWLSNS